MNNADQPLFPEDALLPGTEINGYTIKKVLGRGAFGITYLAEETKLERLVAIKEYLPEIAAKRENRGDVHARSGEHGDLFHYGLSNFLEEAKTLVKFSHPNIVRVLTYFTLYKTAYLVMEYEVGMDLNQYLKSNPRPSEQDLIDIFSPINRGLTSVHSSGYIHRDIKADNIYIRADNSPVLLDFGAARSVVSSDVNQLTRILTIGYAPYEQDNPGWAEQGPWTDIYALGATLYFCVTGNRPVSATERAGAIINNQKDPLPSAVSLCPAEYSLNFLSAIDKALRFKPADRPQDTREWDEMLLRPNEDATIIATSLTSDIQAVAEKSKTSSPRLDAVPPRKASSIWIAVAGLSVAVVIGAYIYLNQPGDNASIPVPPSPDPIVEKPSDDTIDGQNLDQANTTESDESLETPTQQLAPDESQEPIQASVENQPTKVAASEQAASMVLSTMVLAKTACWHYARHEKISGLIEKIKSLPETSDRTRFIVDQNKKLAQSNDGFESNLLQYSQSVEKLKAFKTEEIKLALDSFYQQPQYANDPSYQLLGGVLKKHSDLEAANADLFRQDLIDVSMSGVFTES